MSRGATLLYKCRLCGEFDRSAHAPDGATALAVMMGLIENPSDWARALTPTTHHRCSPVLTGLADFAGVEYDRAEAPASPAAQPEPPHAEAP